AERGARDIGRGAAEILEPTADAVADEDTARVAGAADGLVVGERAVAEGQGPLGAEVVVVQAAAAAHAVEDHAAAAGIVVASQGLVAGKCAVANRSRAIILHSAGQGHADVGIAGAVAVPRAVGAA